MSVHTIHDESELTLVLSIRNKGAPEGVIKDLHEALRKISNSLDDPDLYYRAIDLSGKWRLGQDAFNPWNASNMEAWANLARHASVLDDIRSWLEALKDISTQHLNEELTSIHENDEVNLGEVPLSILAVMHLEFVPLYTRFLDIWSDIEVNQFSSIITEIVSTHGQCKEIEDLIFKFVVDMGGGGDLIEYHLRKNLNEIYGDFLQSKLFRRMIEAMHSRETEFKDNAGNRYIFSYSPGWPDLSVAAAAILAELDSISREPQ